MDNYLIILKCEATLLEKELTVYADCEESAEDSASNLVDYFNLTCRGNYTIQAVFAI
jgi:hypothetical protein